LTLLLVCVGGAGGAAARYLVDGWVSERAGGAFPFGTLVVNLSGSFVLGLLFVLTVESGVLPSSSRAPVMIGFIGAYTTFSTLMLETYRLIEDGAVGLALANVVGSSILGLIAVVAGIALGRAVS